MERRKKKTCCPHYFLARPYIPPVVFFPSTVPEILFHCVSQSQHVMVRLVTTVACVTGLHPRGWQAKVMVWKKKKKKSRDKQEDFCLSHICRSVFIFFLNTVRLFSGRKRCRFINVKLTVTKILLVKGPLWHYAFVCFKIVYCWTVFFCFFLLMLGTLEITSVPLFMSFFKKKQWLNLYDLMLCKFSFS